MITNVEMPKLDQAMNEGTIGRWLKKEGDRVEKGEPLLKIEVDKATFELEADTNGFLRKILKKDGETVSIGQVIAYTSDSLDENIPEDEETKAPETLKSETSQTVAEPLKIRASPLAKRLAQERGIDLAKVKGSGPGGRILETDVLTFKEERKETEGDSGTVSLSRLRKIIAQRMVESKTTIPHFYVEAEVSATEMVKTREDLIPQIEKTSGIRLAFDDLVIRAVALTLQEFPIMNSTLWKDEIRYLPSSNICLAISIQEGLVVPVIKEAEKKRISEIAAERDALVKKARAGHLEPQDIYGGTFTVSNAGMFGVDALIAIINPPQAAILSIGMIKEIPIVKAGRVEIGKMMKIVLSVDHRITDGATGAKFLRKIKDFLEEPRLLIENGI